ncbi:MAG TPA: hypothetical protein VJP80_05710 [Candidatus Saccharimonadales bacterium]|nr:hypothetical protein [Candidatus Saccharimonadales bacterium]
MEEAYEISEKDIQSVMRYLETHDVENATREKAIALLEDLHAGVHSMAHNNPELLEQLQKEVEENRH